MPGLNLEVVSVLDILLSGVWRYIQYCVIVFHFMTSVSMLVFERVSHRLSSSVIRKHRPRCLRIETFGSIYASRVFVAKCICDFQKIRGQKFPRLRFDPVWDALIKGLGDAAGYAGKCIGISPQ